MPESYLIKFMAGPAVASGDAHGGAPGDGLTAAGHALPRRPDGHRSERCRPGRQRPARAGASGHAAVAAYPELRGYIEQMSARVRTGEAAQEPTVLIPRGIDGRMIDF